MKMTLGELRTFTEVLEGIGRDFDPVSPVPGIRVLPLSRIRLSKPARMICTMNLLAWRVFNEPFERDRAKLFEEICPEGFNEAKTMFSSDIPEVTDEQREELSKAMMELLEREVEVPIQQFKMSDIDGDERVTPNDIVLFATVCESLISDYPRTKNEENNVVPIKPKTEEKDIEERAGIK